MSGSTLCLFLEHVNKFHSNTFSALSSLTETAICAPKRKKWYTIEGRRISAPRKGLNIMRKADGTVKKVMVK